MATVIKSTELDFQNIKENLKNFLKNKEEFSDYDFEGSGLSNILDVLAYNTHFNALISNFALNESFLVTAQLRPSVVSLAESLGYIPDSKKSSTIPFKFEINLADIEGDTFRSSYTLLPGTVVYRGEKDSIDYTFSNRVSLYAENRNGIYSFYPAGDPEGTIFLHEGQQRKQDFVVGTELDSVYIIPDPDIDISTVIVRVFEDQSSSEVDGGTEFTIYQNLLDATTVSKESRLYVLRESPNGFFELSFGNGTSLGVSPTSGNVISVEYLRSSGTDANGITTVKLASDILLDGYLVDPGNVSGKLLERKPSSGGADKEDIESIRKNAPYQFAAQNRMVTADDYSTLILKKYSSFISDIKSWGGQDDPNPDFGSVYVSIVWKKGLLSQTITNVRQGILDLADQYSITSFNLKFQDPVETFIGVDVFFQFNPALTGFTQSTVRESVKNSTDNYFSENTGKFGQVFRLSNLLTAVDATDPSVLSSRAEITLNQKLYPQLTVARDYVVQFPVSIREPTLSNSATVFTSNFSYKNQTVSLRNKLNVSVNTADRNNPASNVVRPTNVLEMIDTSGNVVSGFENAGSYDPTTGKVTLNSLNVQSISGGNNYIKVFAIPANKSTVTSIRNVIIKYDDDASSSKAVITETE
jgi:hypothetical protein